MRSFASCIFLILFSVSVLAQTAAPAVRGRIIDATTGEVIDFASIVLTDKDNSTVASADAADGLFAIDKVPEGEYLFSVLLVGYLSYNYPSVY